MIVAIVVVEEQGGLVVRRLEPNNTSKEPPAYIPDLEKHSTEHPRVADL